LRTLALNLPAFVNPLSALRGAREWAAVLSAIFLANLGFGGLQSNFPLFAQLRFAWTAREIGWFIAFVGVCAVLTQGVLLRIAQGQLRAGVLIVIGLSTLAIGLAGIGLAPEPHWLYAAAAVAALGSGLCLPTLSAWMSNQAGPMQQGAVMGATQTTIALANITAPLLAGAAFAYVAAPAPYLLGAALTLMALIASRQVRGDSP
jgi:predicted MFS family arabinose efflux permease